MDKGRSWWGGKLCVIKCTILIFTTLKYCLQYCFIKCICFPINFANFEVLAHAHMWPRVPVRGFRVLDQNAPKRLAALMYNKLYNQPNVAWTSPSASYATTMKFLFTEMLILLPLERIPCGVFFHRRVITFVTRLRVYKPRTKYRASR